MITNMNHRLDTIDETNEIDDDNYSLTDGHHQRGDIVYGNYRADLPTVYVNESASNYKDGVHDDHSLANVSGQFGDEWRNGIEGSVSQGSSLSTDPSLRSSSRLLRIKSDDGGGDSSSRSSSFLPKFSYYQKNKLIQRSIDKNYMQDVTKSVLKKTESASVLSWEDVNVYAKKKFNPLSCSCFSRTKVSSSASDGAARYSDMPPNSAAHPDVNRVFNVQEDTSLPHVCFSNGENHSLESLSSTSSSTKPFKSNHILINVNGSVQSGEALAIMGASGAGKTTLLNVLNFRNTDKFRALAKIKLNGKLINSNELISKTGYVQQDDLFIGTLTVKEHLTFLAMLKMGSKYMSHDKTSRVEEILQDFNLEKCKNTKIGYQDNKKGISGGEKRRLAFASEIITDPQILFCDEPTSGLDSHMALMIIDTIRKLARKGKIIICTIHQPSSQVFDKFDKLCLLAEGRVAYFGKLTLAEEFFKSIDYVIPVKYNPADFYIELLASKRKGKDNSQTVHSICDSYEKSTYFARTLDTIKEADEKFDVLNKIVPFEKKKKFGKYKSSYFTQFIWLLWRQWLNTIREPFATRIMFLQSIVIGIFLGFTYFQQGFDQAGVQNKNGLLFMTLMQACLSYLFGTANQYHAQWNVTRRDIKNRVYSSLVFYLAKTLSELPQNIIFPTITVTIIYWLAGVCNNVSVYFKITLIIVLTANTAVGFGAFLAIVTPNIDSTVGLIGPTFLPLLIFCGFLINSSSIPVYFIWVKYISWLFYANEAMMIALWQSVDKISCPEGANFNASMLISAANLNLTSVFSNLSNSSTTTTATDLLNFETSSQSVKRCLLTGYDVLKYLSMDEANFSFDMGMLVLWCCFWPAIAGIGLYIKAKR